MAGQIIFNSDEIYNVVNSLNDDLQTVENDIKTPLINNFKVLEELDFFNEGIASLTKESNDLYNIYKNLIDKLVSHDESIGKTENSLEHYVDNAINSNSNNKGVGNSYTASINTHLNITTDKINNTASVKAKKIEEIVPNLDYTTQKQLLSSWSQKGSQVVNSLLLSPKNSAILLVYLKDSFKNSINNDTKEPTEYSLGIQKILLEKFINTEENDMLEILNDKSILSGIVYFKEIANANKISISDLLLDDKYNELFLDSVKNIYNDKNLGQSKISNEQIENVKSYINKISSSLNIDQQTLINDKRYIEIIKQGVNL